MKILGVSLEASNSNKERLYAATTRASESRRKAAPTRKSIQDGANPGVLDPLGINSIHCAALLFLYDRYSRFFRRSAAGQADLMRTLNLTEALTRHLKYQL